MELVQASYTLAGLPIQPDVTGAGSLDELQEHVIEPWRPSRWDGGSGGGGLQLTGGVVGGGGGVGN